MPEDKDTKMKGLTLSEEQKKTMAELQKFQQMLGQAQQKAGQLQQALTQQVDAIAEVRGVVKYLRAQLPSPEEMTEEVKLGEQVSLREPKTK